MAVANVEAIKGLSWDTGMLDELLSAWSQVEEITQEYPAAIMFQGLIYQSFWNVVNANKNTKDMLIEIRQGKRRGNFAGNGNSIKADNNALSFIKTGE